MKEISNFEDFCQNLRECGFSLGGGSDKGVFALISYNWENQDGIDSPIKWHTGDRETDPWEWRMRVLEEKNDIAYAKLFFKSSGYITAEWYPYFYAVRRNGVSFDEEYQSGKISVTAKRIYDVISNNDRVALHEIKQLGDWTSEDKERFDTALTFLQSRMFVTMCGRKQKVNKAGEGYGWNSTSFCTVEKFWQERGVTLEKIERNEAYQKIAARVIELNGEAKPKTIEKFIEGK